MLHLNWIYEVEFILLVEGKSFFLFLDFHFSASICHRDWLKSMVDL